MICMNHSQSQALAICSGCNGGICTECACRVVSETIFSCGSLICQEKIENYHVMNKRALEIYQIGKGTKKRISFVGVYFVSFGFIISCFCLFNFNKMQSISVDQMLMNSNLLLLSMGLMFLCAGFYHLLRKNRITI